MSTENKILLALAIFCGSMVVIEAYALYVFATHLAVR
jgi:hypothetical protein